MVAVGANATSASSSGTSLIGTTGTHIGIVPPDRPGVTGMGTIGTGESTTTISSVGGTSEITCHNGGTDPTTLWSICYASGKWGVEPSTVVSASTVNSRIVNNITVTTIIGFTVKDTVSCPYSDCWKIVSTSDIPLRSA